MTGPLGCQCRPYSRDPAEAMGMCAVCEQAGEEFDAESRTEAHARDPDEDDFPDTGASDDFLILSADRPPWPYLMRRRATKLGTKLGKTPGSA